MLKKIFILVLAQSLFAVIPCFHLNAQSPGNRDDIHVPADYPTIQEAINAASSGDRIVVDTGIYQENLDFMQKVVFLVSHRIYGDTAAVAKTILDGGGKGSVLTISFNEYRHAEIEGFTIRNGTGNAEGLGGGILVSNADVMLSNLVITGNSATRGAGVFCFGPAELEMIGVAFSNNTASQSGGGIHAANTQLTLNNCVLFDNGVTQGTGGAISYSIMTQSGNNFLFKVLSTGFYGNTSGQSTGGVYCAMEETASASLNVVIDKSAFQGNYSGYGTAFWVKGDDIQVRVTNSVFTTNESETYAACCGFSGNSVGGVYNCLFTGNAAGTGGTGNGGGVSVFGGAEIDILNCVFDANTAPSGAAIAVGAGGNANILNCILVNNSPGQIALVDVNNEGGHGTIDFCNVQGGQSSITAGPLSGMVWGGANIDQDPVFAGEGDHPFELTEGSPCVDTGIPDVAGLNLPPGDLKGNIRVWDGGSGSSRIDMGAYEYGADPLGTNEPAASSLHGCQLSVSPNPFSTGIFIGFFLERQAEVRITVCDNVGRQIRILMEGRALRGDHRYYLDGSLLDPGIYYCLVTINDEVCVKKVIKMD